MIMMPAGQPGPVTSGPGPTTPGTGKGTAVRCSRCGCGNRHWKCNSGDCHCNEPAASGTERTGCSDGSKAVVDLGICYAGLIQGLQSCPLTAVADCEKKTCSDGSTPGTKRRTFDDFFGLGIGGRPCDPPAPAGVQGSSLTFGQNGFDLEMGYQPYMNYNRMIMMPAAQPGPVTPGPVAPGPGTPTKEPTVTDGPTPTAAPLGECTKSCGDPALGGFYYTCQGQAICNVLMTAQ